MLFALTTLKSVVIINNMKAVLIQKYREVLSDEAFYEIALWHLPKPFRAAAIATITASH